MSLISDIIIILGVLVFAFLICLAVIWLERKFPGKQFDERQKIARGNAYRVSMCVGSIYYLGVMIYLASQEGETAGVFDFNILVVWGLILQVLVLHIYSLLTHSALPMGETPHIAIKGYLLFGVVCLIWSGYESTSSITILIGKENWMRLKLAMGIVFLALAAMHELRLRWKEKD